MGELVHLHIGQAGIQIGESFWERFSEEHGIQSNGKKIENGDDESVVSVLFSENRNGNYNARSIFADLEPTVIDQVKTGKFRDLFSNAQFSNGKEDAANLYYRGYQTVGKELVDETLNKVRKQVEKCEFAQGLMITHAISGGTGSGFCSLLLEKLSEHYEKLSSVSYTIYPSPRFSSTVIEPYNAAFSTLIQNSHIDLSIFFDNEAMYNHLEKTRGILDPKFIDINRVIARYASSLTSSFRFSSKNSYNRLDLKEKISNLVPYNRLNSIIPNLSTFSHFLEEEGKYELQKHVRDLIHVKESSLISCDATKGKYISCMMNFDCEEHLYNQRDLYESIFEARDTLQFVDWSPLGFKTVVNHQVVTKMNTSSEFFLPTISMLSNSTEIHKVFSMLGKKFDKMYSKCAYVWWSFGEGCSTGEHSEARETLAVIEKDYEDAENAGCSSDENEDDDE